MIFILYINIILYTARVVLLLPFIRPTHTRSIRFYNNMYYNNKISIVNHLYHNIILYTYVCVCVVGIPHTNVLLYMGIHIIICIIRYIDIILHGFIINRHLPFYIGYVPDVLSNIIIIYRRGEKSNLKLFIILYCIRTYWCALFSRNTPALL